MAKFTFDPVVLKRGFALAKQVKPVTGDFVLKFMSGVLVIYSADKRRKCRVEVLPTGTAQDFTSDDFFLSADRAALFETDLEKVSVTVTDKGMTVKADGDGQSRQATVKKRLDNSRRAGAPPRPQFEFREFPSKTLEELLRQVSCSALVKETKTEEDMKVNQVHFYPGQSSAMSNARFYASVSRMDGMDLDLSVVSADLPVLRGFCAKAGDTVRVGQTDRELLIMDPSTGTVMSFSRISGTRPPLQILPEDGFTIEVSVDSQKLSKALGWCSMALEGTTRLSLEAKDLGPDETFLVLSSSSQELSRVPAKFISGADLRADFPAAILMNLCSSADSDTVVLRYKHKAQPTILEVRELVPSNPAVLSRHFVQSMKERT